MKTPEEFKDLFHFVNEAKFDPPLNVSVLHECAVATVTWAFLEHGGGHPPLWFIGNSQTGKVEVILTPWRNERQKRAVLMVFREAMPQMGYDLYSTASEAWMAHDGPDTDPAIAKLPPSEREDAKEALTVCSRTKAGGGLLTTFAITQMPGRKPALGQRNDRTNDIAGRVYDLFEDEWDPTGSRELILAKAAGQ